MLLLTSPTDQLQIVTGAAATINVHASWVDTNTAASTITPGRTNNLIITAATTSVAGSPAAGVQRNVKTLHVRNTHATLACDVTVQHTDGTVVAQLYKRTLQVGQALEYTDQGGFVDPAVGAAGGSAWTTGDAKLTLKAVADIGWVMMDDGTIGDATSGATTRANADTQALYTILWNNVTQTYAPVSGGGRGANATADFTAHKTIGLIKQLGRALAVGGGGAGLTARALGQALGEENHTLLIGEMPVHGHNVIDPGHAHFAAVGSIDQGGTSGGGNLAATNAHTSDLPTGVEPATVGISIQPTGGGAGHNVMQPTTFWNVMIKL